MIVRTQPLSVLRNVDAVNNHTRLGAREGAGRARDHQLSCRTAGPGDGADGGRHMRELPARNTCGTAGPAADGGTVLGEERGERELVGVARGGGGAVAGPRRAVHRAHDQRVLAAGQPQVGGHEVVLEGALAVGAGREVA